MFPLTTSTNGRERRSGMPVVRRGGAGGGTLAAATARSAAGANSGAVVSFPVSTEIHPSAAHGPTSCRAWSPLPGSSMSVAPHAVMTPASTVSMDGAEARHHAVELAQCGRADVVRDPRLRLPVAGGPPALRHRQLRGPPLQAGRVPGQVGAAGGPGDDVAKRPQDEGEGGKVPERRGKAAQDPVMSRCTHGRRGRNPS